jgi:hypothetical protein
MALRGQPIHFDEPFTGLAALPPGVGVGLEFVGIPDSATPAILVEIGRAKPAGSQRARRGARPPYVRKAYIAFRWRLFAIFLTSAPNSFN